MLSPTHRWPEMNYASTSSFNFEVPRAQANHGGIIEDGAPCISVRVACFSLTGGSGQICKKLDT